MRLRAFVPVFLAVAALAAGVLPVGPAMAAPAAQIAVFGIPSAGPASQAWLESSGFAPSETATLTLVDTTDPSVRFGMPSIQASDQGEVNSPIPLPYAPDDIVPGTYVLRVAQASGPSATSDPVTIAPPRIDVTGYAGPGSSLGLLLTGLASRRDVVRTATIDGAAATLAPVEQHVNISSNPVVGPTTTSVTLPVDLAPGVHTVEINQVAPAASASTTFRVEKPLLRVLPDPLQAWSSRDVGSRGTIRVSGSGFGPSQVTLSVRDANGHVFALPDLPERGLETVLPGLSEGVAWVTAHSTLIGSSASDILFVRPASMASPTGASSPVPLISPSGETSIRADPNLGVLRLDTRSGVHWDSPYYAVSASPYRFVVQADANMVMYANSGRAIWSSGTASSDGPFTLTATEEDRAVLTTAHGAVLWATPTVATTTLAAGGVMRAGSRFQNERHSLVVQGDGNVVLYHGSKAAYSTRTAGAAGARLVLQADGNLVVYSSAGKPLWANRASTGPGSRLVLQADGNLVEYAANGRAVWSTRTAVR